MNNFLRYLPVVLAVAVVAIVMLACADGLCSACSQAFWSSSDRAKPLGRLRKKVAAAITRGMALALVLTGAASCTPVIGARERASAALCPRVSLRI